MAWPTSKPNSGAFAADSNSIAQSRPELKTMSDAVNDIVDFVDTTGISNGDVLVYDSTSGTIKPGTNFQLLNINAGTNITVDQDSGGGVTISSTGGINNVSEDTSPELGGDLEVGDFSIKSTGIDSGGEGAVDLKITTHSPYKGIFANTDTDTTAGNNNFNLSNNGGLKVYDRTNQVYMGVGNTGFSFFDNSGHRLSAIRGSDFTLQTHANNNLVLAPAGTGLAKVTNLQYNEKVFVLTYSIVNVQLDHRNGNLQEITLTGNMNFTGFAQEIDGASVTLIIKQDGTGNRTFTEGLDSGGRMLFAGGTSTLSTAGGAIDIMTITFAGGIYYASLSTNFS